MKPPGARPVLVAALVATMTAVTATGAARLARPPDGRAGKIEPTDGLVEEPSPRAWALLAEAGPVRSAPDDGAPAIAELRLGELVPYLGETTDEFGRTWRRIAVEGSVQRDRKLLLSVVPPTGAGDGGRWATLDLIDRPLTGDPWDLGSVGGPEAAEGEGRSGPSRSGDEAGPPWWTRVVSVEPEHLPETAGVRSLTLPGVPRSAAEAAVELLGGPEALGEWPEDPMPGRLHVPPSLPVVFRWSGEGWEMDDPARLWSRSLSLLANSDLVLDPDAPTVAGSPPVACWRLVGAVDAYGQSVGGLDEAAETVTTAPTEEVWRPDALGRRNLTPLIVPVVPESLRVPPPLETRLPVSGVVLRDDSRRQAVYLEQRLPAPVTERLRGRTVVLRVRARRAAAAAGPGAASVGLLLDAGGERAAVGAPVGDVPTWAELEFTVPPGADRLRVRLLPTDPSLAVEGGGAVVVDRAVLGLPEWPREPAPATGLAFRIATTLYRPTPGFTRSRLVVTRRPVDVVRGLLLILHRADWPAEIEERIVAGEIVSGMSERQVELAWGAPPGIVAPPDVAGIDARWDYPDRSAVFADGELIAWTVDSSGPVEGAPSPCHPGSDAPSAAPPAAGDDAGPGTGP